MVWKVDAMCRAQIHLLKRPLELFGTGPSNGDLTLLAQGDPADVHLPAAFPILDKGFHVNVSRSRELKATLFGLHRTMRTAEAEPGLTREPTSVPALVNGRSAGCSRRQAPRSGRAPTPASASRCSCAVPWPAACRVGPRS